MQNNNVKPWYKIWWVWIIISAIFFLFLICIIGSNVSNDASTDNDDTTQVSKNDDSDSNDSTDDNDSDSNDTSDYDGNDDSNDTNDDSYSTTDDSSSDTSNNDSGSDATTDQQSALQQADYFANDANMSKAKIYEQLTSSYGGNFSSSDVNYAISHLEGVDWNQNALATAQKYVDDYHMSKSELYDQLTSSYGEQFTASQAQYAINNLD
ncbi:Ltp family lipoprotein [Apilactobacillus kunkeei]|uniref:Ltp family lipoprotein n=1 Tax=Apilactobacillus kunkeei TaxID=148814 RepID=UPI00112788F7|nr:Ltp family lipoprotein [Apilactobacillus kunkeei]TPR53648.1 hypothetical protein DY036_05445 [Apilactobacillus kunkeei]